MACHQYGILALVAPTSRETSGGVAKHLLFSEADKCWLVLYLIFQIYFESWDVCSVCFMVSKIIRLKIYGIDLDLAASQRIHKFNE